MRKRGDAHGTPAQHSKPSRATRGGMIHGGSVQRFSGGATGAEKGLITEIDTMGERVETSRAPITDAIRFLRSHGMVVEYDTPPERMGMMADFLIENGKDMDDAVELFRSLEARELMREAEWERFFAKHRQFEPALRHILDLRPPFVAINHRISFNTV